MGEPLVCKDLDPQEGIPESINFISDFRDANLYKRHNESVLESFKILDPTDLMSLGAKNPNNLRAITSMIHHNLEARMVRMDTPQYLTPLSRFTSTALSLYTKDHTKRKTTSLMTFQTYSLQALSLVAMMGKEGES